MPTSVGPNPSLTIAAIAEMFAERFPVKLAQS
jgi:choline dehydrogenase-like flavoprotein